MVRPSPMYDSSLIALCSFFRHLIGKKILTNQNKLKNKDPKSMRGKKKKFNP